MNIRLVRGPDPFGTRRYPDLRRYDVHLDGTDIGYVESTRRESYRKVGRLRGGKIGSPKHWEAYSVLGTYVGLAYRRADAVDLLVRRASLVATDSGASVSPEQTPTTVGDTPADSDHVTKGGTP